MLLPIQCKMARVALGWTIKDLARQSRISASSVVRFENEIGEANKVTVLAMHRAFEDAGLVFIDRNGGGPGVRVKEETAHG